MVSLRYLQEEFVDRKLLLEEAKRRLVCAQKAQTFQFKNSWIGGQQHAYQTMEITRNVIGYLENTVDIMPNHSQYMRAKIWYDIARNTDK